MSLAVSSTDLNSLASEQVEESEPIARRRLGINSDELPQQPQRGLAITEADFTNSELRARASQGVSSQLGGTFSRGARRGFRQSKGLAGQLIRLVGDETGFIGAIDLGDELVQEAFVEAIRNPARIESLGEINSLSKVGTFIMQTLGEQAFNIAIAATGAGIGALLGKAAVGEALMITLATRAAPTAAGRASQFTAKQVAKRFFRTHPTGAVTGAAAGTFTSFLPINTGEAIQEQRDHFESQVSGVRGVTEPELGPSLAVGALLSGLEVLGFGLVGKAIFGAAKKEVVGSAIEIVLRRVGHASLKSLAAEGGTEAVQEALVIASKSLNDPIFSITDAIASSEGLSRIAFAGVSGLTVGAILGGGGGIATGVSESIRANAQQVHVNGQIDKLTRAINSSIPSGQDEEVQSLLDISLAKKAIVQLGRGAPRSVAAALKAIGLRLGSGTVSAAVVAAKQRYRIVAKALGSERRGLKAAEEALDNGKRDAAAGFAALEALIAAMPATENQEGNTGEGSAVRKVGDEIRTLLAEFNKLSVDQRAVRTSELLDKARKLIKQRTTKPGSVTKGQIEQLLSRAKAYVNASHAKSTREIAKYHKTLAMLRLRTANAINRVRVANKELTAAEAAKLSPEEIEEALAVDEAERAGRFEDSGETTGDQLTIEEQAEDRAVTAAERAGRAEDSGAVLPTTATEIVASVMQVLKGKSDFAFAVGRTLATLPASVKALIKEGKVEAIETSKEVILNLPGAFTSEADAKARSFTTQVEDIDAEDAVVVKTESKSEVTPRDKVPEVVAKLEAQGEEVRVDDADVIITEQVEQLNEEAEALGTPVVQLTTNEAATLAEEDTEIFVRTPTTTRLMHAVVDAEGNLRREDGGLFRLYDTLKEAVKGSKNKTTVHKVKGAKLHFITVKDAFGNEKIVVVSTLTNGRRQSAERQVRKAIDRGLKHTKNKVKLAIAGVRSNGRKVWFHAGEITALGLILDAGSTQGNQKGRYSNPQTLFLDGLAYLMAQQDSNGVALYTIDFRPTDVVVDGKVVSTGRAVDANKAIYGNVAYKDAAADQNKVIPKTKGGKLKDKGFIEWAIDKVLAGEISPTILRGLLWNYGFLSNEEIADFDKMPVKEQERTLLEGLALVQSVISGTEVESVTQGDLFRRGTKIAKGGIQERSVRQPLELETDQDISEETLHLPSSEAQLVPISGEKSPDTSLPYAYADSLSDQSLGYSQHAPHKSTGQVQNFITKWPAAQAALEFALKILHITEKVVLFDEANASLLISIYKLEEFANGNSAERTALYRGYREQIEAILIEAPPGRIVSPPQSAKGADRFTHIFVSKITPPSGSARGTVLMHELGHLVQYTHLDRLSPRLQAIVLDAMNGDTEAFANWMAKVAADMHFGRKVRADNEVDNIFVQIVQDLKKLWNAMRAKLGYTTGFDQFVAALNSHAAAQRGETFTVPKNPIAKQIFLELQAQNKSATIPSSTITEETFTTADFTVDGVLERSTDSFFGNWVDNAKKWAAVLKDDPIRAISHLVKIADSELRSMGDVGLWTARQFRAMPGQKEDSRTVFRMTMMKAGPWHEELKIVLDSLTAARISLWEGITNKKPSAATKAKRAHRDKVTEALLLQVRSKDLSADIRGEVEAIRVYFDRLYKWYTGDTTKTFIVNGRKMKGMGMSLKQRGFKEGKPSYYPLMVDTLFLDSNRKKFVEIFVKHGFSEKDANNIRMKVTRDEDGGLNNGFQEDAGTDQFFGPGAAFRQGRADWPLALRKDLVEAGFYHKDIATTMTAYTEMMVRRAVWQQRFQETDFTPPMRKRYKDAGIEDAIDSPVASLLLRIAEARKSGKLNEWQYKRIVNDILPAYAGQLGLRTNSKLRRISAGLTIYQNLRLLPFAIFSQFVDVGTLIQRGDWKSFETGLQGILNKATREDAITMLKALGAIRDGVTEHVLNDQALNTFMTGNAKRINDLFFRYNGMEGWTNMIRTAAAISGREFILRHSKLALEGNKTSQKYMDNLGLGDKERLAEAAAWDGSTTDNDFISAAILRYVDEGMIRPDPTIRPVHVSDPGYMIFNHLKGFLWGFHATFIQHGIHEAKVHQNLLPLLTLGMLALPFAAVGYELRRWITTGGNPRPGLEGGHYLVELFERGGLLGPWQLVADMEQANAFGKPFVFGIAGPTAEQLFDFYDKDLSSWLPRALPVAAGSPVARDWVRDRLE